eukprot:3730109-Pyramimonas_sp.AAC.1
MASGHNAPTWRQRGSPAVAQARAASGHCQAAGPRAQGRRAARLPLCPCIEEPGLRPVRVADAGPQHAGVVAELPRLATRGCTSSV